MNKPGSHDVVRMCSLAIVNSVPVVGGAAGTFVGELWQKRSERAADTLLQNLEEEVHRLKDRIDAAACNRDELVEMTQRCHRMVQETTNEAKLRAAARLMANAMLSEGDPERLSYTVHDHFARAAEGLSNGAIAVLGKLARVAVEQADPLVSENVYRPYRYVLGNVKMHLSDLQLPHDLMLALFAELQAACLLDVEAGPIQDGEIHNDKRIVATSLGLQFAIGFLLERAQEPVAKP